MRIHDELIYLILLKHEGEEDVDLSNYTEEQIEYHEWKMFKDDRLLEGDDYSSIAENEANIMGLTSKGHKELKRIREQKENKSSEIGSKYTVNIVGQSNIKLARIDQLILQGYEVSDKFTADLTRMGTMLFSASAFNEWKDNCLFFLNNTFPNSQYIEEFNNSVVSANKDEAQTGINILITIKQEINNENENSTTPAWTININKLNEIINKSFNGEELKILQSKCGITEEFFSITRSNLVNEIVGHMHRRNEIPRLFVEALAERPKFKDQFLDCIEKSPL